MVSIRPFIALHSARLEAHLTTHAFTLLFTCVYLFSIFAMFVLGFYTEYIDDKDKTRVVLWFLSLARGTGYTLNLNTPLILLLSSRLLLTHIRDTSLSHFLPLDAAFPSLHIVAGYIIAFSVLPHAAFHLTWITLSNGWVSGIFQITSSVITGFLLVATLLTIIISARPSIRKRFFRIFRLLHVGAAFVFFVLLLFHGNFQGHPETFKWITPAVIIYALDRMLRRITASSVELSLTADNASLQGDLLVLRVPRPFTFRAGQYAEIQVPSINIEWHPFTIASAPYEDQATFCIKACGDWTNKLRDEMEQRLQGGENQPLRVKVRGPYGAPSQHVEGYERVVLVSGGVGSTPFAAISKDLHLKNAIYDLSHETKQTKPDFDYGTLSKYDERVRVAISNLYGVDIHSTVQTSEDNEQRSVYVTDMLNLTANDLAENAADESDSSFGIIPPPVAAKVDIDSINGIEQYSPPRSEHYTSSDYSNSDTPRQESALKIQMTQWKEKLMQGPRKNKRNYSEDEEMVLQRLSSAAQLQHTKRKKLAHMLEGKAKLLAFLHTTRFQFFLLLTILARMTIACVGSILTKRLTGERGDLGSWVTIADISLMAILVVVLPLTILLEMSYMRFRYFSNFGRCIDLVAFLPLTLFCIALDIKMLMDNNTENQVLFIVRNAVIIPLQFILMGYRMHRSVRLRSLLTDHKRDVGENVVPEVDFVWTTRDEADDLWLRNELAPLANGTQLRLHRYVTRAKEVDIEASADILTSVHSGRPEWDETFQRIAVSAPSRSVIGVFFCGPKPMGAAVQASIRRVEIASHLRAAYLSRTPERVLISDLGIPRGFVIRGLQKRGCGVRFVFREENFS